MIPDQVLHLIAYSRGNASDAKLQRLRQAGGLGSRGLSQMLLKAPAQQVLVICYSGCETAEIRTAAYGAMYVAIASDGRH